MSSQKKKEDMFADLMSSYRPSSSQSNRSLDAKAKNLPLSERQKLGITSESNGQSGSGSIPATNWSRLDMLDFGEMSGSSHNSTPVVSTPALTPLIGGGGTNVPPTKSSISLNDSSIDLLDIFKEAPKPSETPNPNRHTPMVSPNTGDHAAVSKSESRPQISESSSTDSQYVNISPNDDRKDDAIAALLDMGFTVEQSTEALIHTDSGYDVNQAIDYLMNKAHEKTKASKVGKNYRNNPNKPFESEDHDMNDMTVDDLGKLVNNISGQFISKASMLWSQGRKNIQKKLEELNNPGWDDDTPAWMRNQEIYKEQRKSALTNRFDDDAQEFSESSKPPRNTSKKNYEENLTTEAMLLESDGPPVPPRRKSSQRLDNEVRSNNRDSYKRPSTSSTPSSNSIKPVSRSQAFKDSLMNEDEVYISPARRNRKPLVKVPSERSNPTKTQTVRPKPPLKSVPAKFIRPTIDISNEALQAFNSNRTSGGNAFKLGNFPQAKEYYDLALRYVPSPHLYRIIALSNRASCNLKLGNPKAVLTDVSEALTIIGLVDDYEIESGKTVKDFYLKLIQRKAEALENLEKYSEAAATWNELIEKGVASKVVLDGKRRCQTAANPKPNIGIQNTTQLRSPRPTIPTKPARLANPERSEAVNKIRKAVQQTENEENEKFALLDQVESKITNWKKGKEDNLRALLASLDTILDPSYNWKKIGMSDLILEKKVKINYMKAVAKTHPDKTPGNATTEQKMIAQAVFVSLNHAWDKFKEINNMK